MKTNYTIQNFRVFDKKGVTVEFSPLTFLVGCNSSGKSSIVKSLTLLKTFFKQEFSKDNPVMGSKIDFSVKPNDSLGSFRNVVRSSSRNKTFTLAYDVHSDYLNKNINISLTFGEGDLGNGRVIGLLISNKEGSVILKVDSKYNLSGNLLFIKDSFKNFLFATFYSEEACRNNSTASFDIGNTDMLAIEKFVETGVMTYYSVLDEIKEISSSRDIKHLLVSRIKGNKFKDRQEREIDLICDDYASKGFSSFIDYYRSLEDSFLYTPYQTKRIIPDMLNGNNPRHDSVSVCQHFSKNKVVPCLDDYSYLLEDPLPGGIPLFESKFDETNAPNRRVDYLFVQNTLSSLQDNSPYSSNVLTDEEARQTGTIHHLYYDAFREYLRCFLEEVFSIDITEGIDYISSSRIQVRRLYPMDDSTEFTSAVRRYFDTKRKFLDLNPPIRLNLEEDSLHFTSTIVSNFVPGSFMNKWLRVFKIGDHISLEMDKNGLSLLLKVYNSVADKKGRLLADMGYGITQLFSILLQVEEMIMSSLYKKFNGLVTPMEAKKNGVEYLISNYTDSPIDAYTVAIEEPEIHLHPKYQSLLAEMFFEAYKEYNIQFIVETHSEYIIRRLQTLVADKLLKPTDISISYLADEEHESVGEPKVKPIRIKEDGFLSDSFGSGFFDEGSKWSKELIDKKFS